MPTRRGAHSHVLMPIARSTLRILIFILSLAALPATGQAAGSPELHGWQSQAARVTISRDGACFEVVVADDGVYSMTLPVPSADGQHRGMYLMTTMVDDFHLTRGTESRAGTVVRVLVLVAVDVSLST